MTHDLLPLSGRLHIDRLALAASGMIGMTHCPGRCTPDQRGRRWQRSLDADLQVIRLAGFDSVLTLLPDEELTAFGVRDLGARIQQVGLGWRQFPIMDFGVPDGPARRAWPTLQAELTTQLRAGQSLLVHCAAGLGRTGTMVALLLKALGQDSATAIAAVRAARPGTIETPAQHDFVVGFAV